MMETEIQTLPDIRLSHVTAPLDLRLAWEVEALLLEVFEYGDYSFRAALRGDYADTLCCSFALAHRGPLLIGAAGCLYSHASPAIALLGPVAVRSSHRGRGIGAELIHRQLDHLEAEGCRAVYLGVADGHPAARLYARLGFGDYRGIVMRYLWSQADRFDAEYWRAEASVEVREVRWGDFPAVQALASVSASMYTYDLPRNLFSSRYVPPERFLGIFPEMMGALGKYGGVACVLVARPAETVVGIAQVRRLPGPARQHLAELDFYVHDNFLEHATTLVRETMLRCRQLPVRRLRCHSLDADHLKRIILVALGARPIATLERSVCIGGEFLDIVVHELEQPV